MTAPTPAQKQAARRAALTMERYILEMFEAAQTGQVAVNVDAGGLEPVKTITTKGKRIGVARGRFAEIEKVG